MLIDLTTRIRCENGKRYHEEERFKRSVFSSASCERKKCRYHERLLTGILALIKPLRTVTYVEKEPRGPYHG